SLTGVSTRPRKPAAHLRSIDDADRRPGTAERIYTFGNASGSPIGGPSRTVPCQHDFVQPCATSITGRSGEPDRGCETQSEDARQHDRQFSGYGRSVSDLASE